ncbi:hypothetical protein BKA66DRAFT_516624 [Pyrenochaeta sp. MPI-SDFR-AT-0127]|nr:hypothetical protein BKA66DRAFT_516624 [Pyrenochaeta sp. MPI-SDFR-AT-0127]
MFKLLSILFFSGHVVGTIWSQAAWFNPTCVFVPKTAQVMAAEIRKLGQTKTPFAIRSGGHMAAAGHQSLDDGVMIVTTALTEMTLVREPNDFGTTFVRAGPSFRWLDLYSFLEPHGLLAIGGRVASVGSGLLLGGGLSYFSSEYGWAANSVLNFEVATADGRLLQANAKENTDLFWALKGGSNNFGVATRYDLQTYPNSKMYGGMVTWPEDAAQAYLDAQTAFMLPGGGHEDSKAAIQPDISWSPLTNTTAFGNMFLYAGPVVNPKALENFTAIPTTSSTVALQNFTQVLAPSVQYGKRDRRWSYRDTSIKFAPETMNLIYRVMIDTAKEILIGVNCTVGAAIQPITQAHIQAARDKGGDALDLNPADGGFVISLYYAQWFDPADDDKIAQWSSKAVETLEAEATKLGILYAFKFLNDGGIGQHPISTYGGGRSLAKLKAIANKYDPKGVFQTLVPGFKLSSEPQF